MQCWARRRRSERATGADEATIEAFVRDGCPHCAKAEEFLARLQQEQPSLKIVVRDVQKEPAALDRLKELARTQGAGAARVPAVYVGGQLIIGYSEEASTDKLIRSALAGRAASAAARGGRDLRRRRQSCVSAERGARSAAPPESFEVSLFGRTLTLDDVGLPAFTLAMGLLDGFNPCSMWVLLLMISLLAPMNNRRRMLAIAGTFVLIKGIAYFLFMAAWLNLFLRDRTVTRIATDHRRNRDRRRADQREGFLRAQVDRHFAVDPRESKARHLQPHARHPARRKPRARRSSARSILAMLVQMVEFLCTSGFPALFTRILTLRELDTAAYYGYLLLYIAAYMLDDIIILTIGVVMLSRHRLQEREGRVLKLVSGLVMIGLGVYLIFFA